MGWFSKKKTCDWCGKTFKGDGIADGEIVLCSQTCFAEKNAPPIPAAPAAPQVTPEGVESDVQAATSAFEECQRNFQAWIVATEEAQRHELASQVLLDESNAWRYLSEAAQGLTQLGVDATAFDGLFQQYANRPNANLTRLRFPGYQAEFEAAARLVESLLASVKR